MQMLMYFLIWGAFIFLMMRFGCGAHVIGHRHSRRDKSGNEADSVRASPQSSAEGAANSPKNMEQVNEHKH